MTTLARILVLICLIFAFKAYAQPRDEPVGAPYNVGPKGDATEVSLRDFVAARIDQLQAIADERDQRYSQRFEAQQQALQAALDAVKQQGASALQSAKEAVTKAEEAANKRFDSVNEFRGTLTDQANTFMSKAEADARLKAMEENVAKNAQQINDMASRSAGAAQLWTIIGAIVVLLVAIGGLAMNFNRQRSAVK